MTRLDAKPFVFKPALLAVAMLGGWVWMAPAIAAPPTVVPSPGYDARLQEQRAAQSSSAPASETLRPAGPAPRHHVRRTHHGAY